jgi:glycosyltransferase involved in cell wall biosynthesis
MHILIIPSEHFITQTQPLGGIFQYHQAKALNNAGHQIGVLSVGYITPRYLIDKYIYKKEEKINDINIKRYYKQLYFPHRYMPFKILKNNYIKMAGMLYGEYIKEFGMPDIIHAHNFLYAGVIAEFLKDKYGIKYIITEHSSSFVRNKLSNEKIISIENVAKKASKVTAVSSSFNNILKEYTKTNIDLLSNIVDGFKHETAWLSKENLMNVVILPTAYPNIYNDHSSIFVQDQAEALAKSGLNVDVVGAIPISFKYIFKKRFLKFGTFKYKKNGLDVKLVLFPSIPKLKFFNEFVRTQINKYLLKKHYANNSIDVIHVHNSTAGKAALWMKQKFNIPYIVTEHSTAYARKLVSQKEIKDYSSIYKNASARVAVSKEFCTILEDTFDLKFDYVPNVVNTEYFLPKEEFIKEDFQFINIGYLDKKKNQTLLIRAFSKAFHVNKNVKLSILGGGPEYNNLQKLINELDMQNQIKLFGFAKREQVLEQLQKSDAFVLSSKYETFGVVVIEAMSCGLPVVATKCGGPESIIENDELGVLVENDNLKELSSAVKSMYENRTNYSSDKIRTHVVENFSEITISNKLINIYRKIDNAN